MFESRSIHLNQLELFSHQMAKPWSQLPVAMVTIFTWQPKLEMTVSVRKHPYTKYEISMTSNGQDNTSFSPLGKNIYQIWTYLQMALVLIQPLLM